MTEFLTNSGQTAFARVILDIDGPFPRLTASRFLGRVRQLILAQTQNGLHSKQTEEQALKINEEMLIAVQGLRYHFAPLQSLEDPPVETKD